MDNSQALDIFAEYATDEALEVGGAWFPLKNKVSRVLVARMSNEAYTKDLVKTFEALNAKEGTPGFDDMAEAAYTRLLARHILKGWENITFKGQKDFPYSVENAETLLKVKDFRKLIIGFSETFEAYKAKVEEDLGNA